MVLQRRAVSRSPRRLDRLEFELENRSAAPHATICRVEGLAPATYRVVVAGRTVATVEVRDEQPVQFEIPIQRARTAVRIF